MPLHLMIDKRNHPEAIRYSPNRDLAWCYESILLQAEKILLEGRWRDLDCYVEDGLVNADIEEGWISLAETINEAQGNFEDSMETMLRRHGWFDVEPEARVAICAVIGRITFGAMWLGIQETINPDTEKPLTSSEMAERGYHFARLMSKPWWLRRIILWWRAGRK